MKNLFESTREASIQLALLDTETINQVLNDVADAAIAQTEQILEANAKDLARMDQKNPMYDRLKLTRERIEGIAADTSFPTRTCAETCGAAQRSRPHTCECAVWCDWNRL